MKALDSPTTVAVTAQSENFVTELGAGFEPLVVSSEDAARDAVLRGEADAALMVDGNSAAGVRVIAARDAPCDLVAGLSIAPELDLRDANAADPPPAGISGWRL